MDPAQQIYVSKILGTVSTSSLIGVGIACGGNVLISLALTVQKLAHRRNEEAVHAKRTEERRTDTPSPSPPGTSTPSSSTLTPSHSHNQTDDNSYNDRPSYASIVKGDSSQEQGREYTAVPVLLLPEGTDEPSISGSRSRSQSPAPGPIKVHVRLDSPIHKHSQLPVHDQVNGDGDERGDKQESDTVEEGMYLRSKLWWMGLSLIAIGEGGNFLSYGFAPASVVAPLGTVALIANCVFAPLILRERFHKRELFGMALAVIGAVTVVWSSNAKNPRLDPSALLQAIQQLPFLLYTLFNILLLIPLLFLSESSYGNQYIVIDVGICALFGGYTVLSTKALSSLLSNMFLDAFQYPITWGLVGVVAATSVGQIKWLNRALMRFQSKEVIPTQFVFFSLAAIIGSAVLFQEFRDVPFSSFVNFAFGIATTFFGVYLLTSSQDEDGNDNHDNSDDSEQRPRPQLPPQRASSSASLNLLLPTLSASTERSPLLYASQITNSHGQPSASISVPSYSSSLGRSQGRQLSGRGRIRLTSRASTDFPTLGLGSQAGFLLMATTPPPNSILVTHPHAQKERGRDRSLERERERTIGEEEQGITLDI